MTTNVNSKSIISNQALAYYNDRFGHGTGKSYADNPKIARICSIASAYGYDWTPPSRFGSYDHPSSSSISQQSTSSRLTATPAKAPPVEPVDPGSQKTLLNNNYKPDWDNAVKDSAYALDYIGIDGCVQRNVIAGVAYGPRKAAGWGCDALEWGWSGIKSVCGY